MATVKEFFSEDDLKVIRYHYQHVVQLEQRLTDEELQTALHVAASRNLMPPPIATHIYFLKRRNREQLENGEWGDVMKLTIQPGIDGLRLIAERTGKHLGTSRIEFEHDQNGWPKRAFCTVYKLGPNGQKSEFPGEAFFDEYAQFRFVKGGGRSLTKMWEEKPHIMVGKCAESAALHRAFPSEASGLYTPEEMGGAEEEAAAAHHELPGAQMSTPATPAPAALAPPSAPQHPHEVGPFVRSVEMSQTTPPETICGWIRDWERAWENIEADQRQGLDPHVTMNPAIVKDREDRLAKAGYNLKTIAHQPASPAAPPVPASAPPMPQALATSEKIKRLAQVTAQACTAYGTKKAVIVKLINEWARRANGQPALSTEGRFAADILESEYQAIVAGFKEWERTTREKQSATPQAQAEASQQTTKAQAVDQARAEFEGALAAKGEDDDIPF